MTREALNKLNDAQLHYCCTLSCIIGRTRESGERETYERSCGKLRGFLEALCQMGCIGGIELKALYLWFFSQVRTEEQCRKQ